MAGMDRGWGRVNCMNRRVDELCKSSLFTNDLRYEDLIGVVVSCVVGGVGFEGRPWMVAILSK